MPDYSSIKVTKETKQDLAEQKPDGMTWDLYLSRVVDEVGSV